MLCHYFGNFKFRRHNLLPTVCLAKSDYNTEFGGWFVGEKKKLEKGEMSVKDLHKMYEVSILELEKMLNISFTYFYLKIY